MAAVENGTTNPLDFPRYVRSLRPSLPDSLPYYLDEELDKVSVSLRSLEEAVSNDAAARISEERIARITADEAFAARIVNVTAEFNTSLTAANARITTEEIARATADEALASRIVTVEADFEAANSATNARVTSEQLARSTADEALAARIDTVQASYADVVTSTNARFSSEIYARSTQDEALASRIDTLQADFNNETNSLSAAITTEQTVRANADSALANQINTVSATANSNSAAITAEQTARANGDSALASSITTLNTQVSNNTAAITNEQTARANGDSVLAGSISTLTTTVSGHTASISTQQSSVNGLLLKYGVTLDSNGYITGFRQNNNGNSGEFIVTADSFKVVMPGSAAITPFQVSAGLVQINGNLVVSGTITSTKIADDAVNTDKIGAGAVTVPYTYDGSSSVYCPEGSETTVLEMPAAVSVGDSKDGGAVIMFFGEIDSGTEKDMGLHLRLYVSVNGAAYTLAGTTKGGLRTSGANSYFDMPVSLMHSVTTAQTLRVKVTSIPYIVDTASGTRPGYIRSPKVAIMGAKR